MLKNFFWLIVTVIAVVFLFKIVFFVTSLFLKLILLFLIIGVVTTFLHQVFKKD